MAAEKPSRVVDFEPLGNQYSMDFLDAGGAHGTVMKKGRLEVISKRNMFASCIGFFSVCSEAVHADRPGVKVTADSWASGALKTMRSPKLLLECRLSYWLLRVPFIH